MPKKFVYHTSCVESDGDSINNMRDDAIDIGYEAMLRKCEGLVDWAVEHGYERSTSEGSGLTLRNDWHVSYHKSIYRGKLCYFLVWSAIEWIWIDAEEAVNRAPEPEKQDCPKEDCNGKLSTLLFLGIQPDGFVCNSCNALFPPNPSDESKPADKPMALVF